MQPVNTRGESSDHRFKLAVAINEILKGRLNSTGTFTMLNGTTSTTVADPNAHQGSQVFFSFRSASTPTPYVSANANGSFTITHADPGADKTLGYLLAG